MFRLRKPPERILENIEHWFCIEGFLEPKSPILEISLKITPSFCASKFDILKTWLQGGEEC
ncbi:hypothetical protein Patl1_05101 [Pistacia atlantica]|uniref:Uncharacterized protein n=1 Tax=Pistacia atlantica TaxID=434234 RepID=A0ACC1BUS3_9ROSI|nr:hypothetical protein Patl1_05101 [Pistacia atlantica]